jgi:2'-5' RNA ligase
LTLAKFKSPRPQVGLESVFTDHRDESLGRFEISEFVLFESKLSPKGAEYKKIARFGPMRRSAG